MPPNIEVFPTNHSLARVISSSEDSTVRRWATGGILVSSAAKVYIVLTEASFPYCEVVGQLQGSLRSQGLGHQACKVLTARCTKPGFRYLCGGSVSQVIFCLTREKPSSTSFQSSPS